MKVKGMLKFALCALLFSAGAMAFAEDAPTTPPAGPITLSNNQTMTWDWFAGVLNGTTKVQGTYSEDDPGIVSAKQKQTAAQTETNTKKGEWEAAQAVLDNESEDGVTAKLDAAKAFLDDTSEDGVKAKLAAALAVLNDKSPEGVKAILAAAQDALNDESETGVKAKLAAAQAALQDYINSLETVYNDSVDFVASKRELISAWQSEQGNLNSDLQTAQGNLTTAKNDYNNLVNQLNALPKKTKSETVGWMQTYKNTADLFENAYENDKLTPKIWYTYTSVKSGVTLYVSFLQTQPTYTPENNKIVWTQIDPVAFDNTVISPTDAESEFKTRDIATVYIVFGKDFADLNTNGDTPTYTYKVNNYDVDSKRSLLVSRTVSAVTTVSEQAKYQVQTTTNEVQDAYKQQETTLQTKIAAAAEVVTQRERELNGFHEGSEGWKEGDTDIVGVAEEVARVKKAITNTQAEITNLVNNVNPALKKKWQDAQAGTLTGDETYTGYKTAVTNAQTAVDDAEEKVTNAQKAVDDAEAAVTNAQKAVDDAEAAVQTAQNNYDEAETAATNAKTAYEEAQAAETQANNGVTAAIKAAQDAADAALLDIYKKGITLTGDVTVNTPVTVDYSGNIKGGGNIITLAEGNNFIFTETFNGQLADAAFNLPEGAKFAQYPNGKFIDAASWNGTTGRFYNDAGTLTEYDSFELFGFGIRKFYGVNFATSKIAKLAPDTKVYSITTYTPAGTSAPYYVNYKGSEFVNEAGDGFTIAKNMFISSATSDAQSINGVANLIYDGNKCKNVVIEDREDFYAPFDITAAQVTVNRTFSKGFNTVCLPFELNKSFGDIQVLCTYDVETTDKFWFTKQENAIAANTPLLLVANSEFTLNIPSGTIIKQTEKQIVELAGQTPEQSMSYGTFKLVNADQFKGAYNSYKVYGLKGDKFQPAGEGAKFPAFRSVITSEIATRENQAPRRIGIRDEKGIEINLDDQSGVEDVASDMASLEITAGAGEIIFNSDANYGKVEIFSIDGRVAAIADVVEGTTTVNVKHGVYIVMGKKILVK